MMLVAAGQSAAAAHAGDLDRGGLIERINAVVEEAMAATPIAGVSVAVEHHGDLLLLRGYGSADLENTIPVNPETVFRVGSITKQFTALAILQLVEEGSISLQDEITRFLPDYPTQGHTITIHHLLTHTSGITSFTALEDYPRLQRLDLTDEELVARFANEPFDFAPGEKWQYSNSGYYLLGMIIEKVSGEPYREYVRNHIFRPLGMIGSMYCDPVALVPNRAHGYDVVDGRLVNSEPISMDPPGAAGGLCSAPLDLVRWQHALDQNLLISAASREIMLQPARLNDGSATDYAYGMYLLDLDGHRWMGHGGGITGFIAAFDDYPDDDLVVAVLANTGSADSGRIARDIARLVLGIPLPSAKDLPLPDDGWRATYPGTYVLRGNDTVVSAEADALVIGTSKGVIRLMYQGGGVFIPESMLETKVRFVVEDGVATEMVIVTNGQELRAPRK